MRSVCLLPPCRRHCGRRLVRPLPRLARRDGPEAKAYREALEQHQHAETVLDEEAYLNKITQLFFFRKKLSSCYNEAWSTDPVFLALKDTVQRSPSHALFSMI